MKIRGLIFLMFACFFQEKSYAQNYFFKKAVILLSDSTRLDGYVERISESAISKNLEYKNTPDQKNPTTIPASKIRRLVFLDDSMVFERVPYAPHQKPDSAKVVEYRLAKKMLEGYADLLKMQLPLDEMEIIHNTSNTFIYFLKIDTSFYVLDQQERWIEPGDETLFNRNMRGYNYIVLNNYKKTLLLLFRNQPRFLSRVENLKLEDREIVPLIFDFNNAHPEIPRKTFIEKERTSVSHGPILGFTRFPVDGYSMDGLELGYSIHIVNPQINGKLSHQLGFSLLKLFGSENTEYERSFQDYKIFVSSRYPFFKGNTSPFLGIGISQIIFEESPGIAGMFSVSAGATVFNRMDIALNAEFSKPSVRAEKALTLNLGYRFGKTD